MKKTINVAKNAEESAVIELIKKEYPNLISGEIKKVIYIPGKIINIIKFL